MAIPQLFPFKSVESVNSNASKAFANSLQNSNKDLTSLGLKPSSPQHPKVSFTGKVNFNIDTQSKQNSSKPETRGFTPKTKTFVLLKEQTKELYAQKDKKRRTRNFSIDQKDWTGKPKFRNSIIKLKEEILQTQGDKPVDWSQFSLSKIGGMWTKIVNGDEKKVINDFRRVKSIMKLHPSYPFRQSYLDQIQSALDTVDSDPDKRSLKPVQSMKQIPRKKDRTTIHSLEKLQEVKKNEPKAGSILLMDQLYKKKRNSNEKVKEERLQNKKALQVSRNQKASRAFSPSLLNSRYAIQDLESKTLPNISNTFVFQSGEKKDKLLKQIYKKQITKRIINPGPQFFSPQKITSPVIEKTSMFKNQ